MFSLTNFTVRCGNAYLKVNGLDPELVDDEGEEVDAEESNHQTQHQAPHQEPHLPHYQLRQDVPARLTKKRDTLS
jgi:hypothetical protein